MIVIYSSATLTVTSEYYCQLIDSSILVKNFIHNHENHNNYYHDFKLSCNGFFSQDKQLGNNVASIRSALACRQNVIYSVPQGIKDN